MAGFLSILFGKTLFGKRAKDLGTDSAKAKNDAALVGSRSTVESESGGRRLAKPKKLLKGGAGKTGTKRDRMAIAKAQKRLRDDWEAIRSQIETLAAAPTIDRTTRLRYARMDRRRYADLVDVLAKESRLDDRSEDFEKAAALWAKYRSGRSQPSMLDLSTMAQFRKALVPVGTGK